MSEHRRITPDLLRYAVLCMSAFAAAMTFGVVWLLIEGGVSTHHLQIAVAVGCAFELIMAAVFGGICAQLRESVDKEDNQT